MARIMWIGPSTETDLDVMDDQPCPSCRGRGDEDCLTCAGEGYV